MQVLVNSDHHLAGGASVSERVESIVADAVDRFETRLTRVEVHLTDENGPKHGDKEKRCMMEARIGGLRPLAVKHQAPTLLEAIEGAADKLERALDHALGKLDSAPRKPLRELAVSDGLDDDQASDDEDLDGIDEFDGDSITGRSDTTH